MAILKFSASAVAAQIAHARACKTFLPNWNGPVDRPALILIVGNGVHLRSNGIDGTTTRIVTTEQADPSFAFADGMNPFRDTDWMAQRRMAFRDLTGQFYRPGCTCLSPWLFPRRRHRLRQGARMRGAHPCQLAGRAQEGDLGLQIRHAHRGRDPRLD